MGPTARSLSRGPTPMPETPPSRAASSTSITLPDPVRARELSWSAGATLAGSGSIQPGSGKGITLAANSTFISGGVQSGTTAGHGLTLDNTVAGGTILDASVGSAKLTFYLGAGTTNGAGAFTFGSPNTNSTFLTVLGNTVGEVSLAAGDTITLTDLTGGNLQLGLGTPYLLIQAGTTPNLLSDNDLFAGLTTTGRCQWLTKPEWLRDHASDHRRKHGGRIYQSSTLPR